MRHLVLEDVSQTVSLLRAPVVLSDEVRSVVAGVIDGVRRDGDDALRRYSAEFDHVDLAPRIGIAPEAIDAALASLPPELTDGLRLASRNIRAYHEHEAPTSWRTVLEQGQVVGQEIVPLEAAGLYVPGGLADYPSSVLMTVIPAQVAGVRRVVVCSPPRKDGGVARGVAAACALLGVSDLYPIGGAQAVAALALGTESIGRCDIVAGPGNVYVTEAKRQLMGTVAIDSLAGPSEVLVIADETADPTWLAADVLAQAEHGSGAMGAVLSLSASLAERLLEQIAATARDLGAATENVTIIECASLAAAIDFVNAFGPEHLELHVQDPASVLKGIHNAGAVFLGRYAATAFADYAAGTNHVLPTGGAARFAQGLSTSHFVKRVGVLELDADSAAALARPVSLIAREEGLRAHALSAELRGRGGHGGA